MKNLRDVLIILAALAGVIWLCIAHPSRADAPVARVSVALVLAADVSGSIDEVRWKMQRDGYAAAVRHPRFLQAVEATPTRSVAVTFIEWSGPDQQAILVPWTVIASAADADAFAEAILAPPRAFSGSTAVAAALRFAHLQLDINPFPADRRVIDLSGDGPESTGGDVDAARDAAVLADITINGIAILGGTSSYEQPVDEHYRLHVQGGPGSFVMVADDFSVFAYALVAKLIREVAGL